MGAGVAPSAFAARIERLGPFPADARFAVAVSGGGDSLALAVLARTWAASRGVSLRGLIVDHGLRPGAAAEAETAAAQLAALAIPAQILLLTGLAPGPGLAARARAARYAALEAAGVAAGVTHLLLGHHAADQAETLILRALAGSDVAGMAGMGGAVRWGRLWLLRPLLDLSPSALRATLTGAGIRWSEDPSNADPAATRARLRAHRADRAGTGFATRALRAAAATTGAARAVAEAEAADYLARCAPLRAEGYALLPGGPVPLPALAWLLAAVAGSPRVPPGPGLAVLAAAPRPATLGGARLLPAGRLAPGGWLLVREAARQAPAVPARSGAVWDRRFRLDRAAEPDCASESLAAESPSSGTHTLGALGADASRLRRISALPAAVLETLPAIRRFGQVLAVPPLDQGAAGFTTCFVPPGGWTFAPFQPSTPRDCVTGGCATGGDTLC